MGGIWWPCQKCYNGLLQVCHPTACCHLHQRLILFNKKTNKTALNEGNIWGNIFPFEVRHKSVLHTFELLLLLLVITCRGSLNGLEQPTACSFESCTARQNVSCSSLPCLYQARYSLISSASFIVGFTCSHVVVPFVQINDSTLHSCQTFCLIYSSDKVLFVFLLRSFLCIASIKKHGNNTKK